MDQQKYDQRLPRSILALRLMNSTRKNGWPWLEWKPKQPIKQPSGPIVIALLIQKNFGHMPVPIRVSLNAMSNWCIAREVYGRFVQFCRSSGNAKLTPVERLFERNPHISWMMYSEPMAKV